MQRKIILGYSRKIAGCRDKNLESLEPYDQNSKKLKLDQIEITGQILDDPGIISTTICGYDPSAPFVCSGFLVSYRIRSAIKTSAPQTAPHLKYIQGIGIPNKASFEILAMNTGLK